MILTPIFLLHWKVVHLCLEFEIYYLHEKEFTISLLKNHCFKEKFYTFIRHICLKVASKESNSDTI